VDHLSKEKRSWNMSRIRSKDTKPEIIVRSMLHKMGYRFRLHRKDLPGKPDITLPKYKTVIFVHGCFWHGHKGCKRSNVPKTNQDYWILKIQKNIQRDKYQRKQLKRLGWHVLILWECQIEKTRIIEKKIKNLLQ
ncbi:very short patch repair endonuclease, partial [Planctomycetota bacterium]